MNWDALKDRLHDAVHGMFAIPAVYSYGGVELPIVARCHNNKITMVGDLEGTGFTQTVLTQDYAWIDTTEVVPQEHALVDFGRGRVYSISNVDPMRGVRYVRVELRPRGVAV